MNAAKCYWVSEILTWSEDWNGFTLSVSKSPQGYRARIVPPWDLSTARTCKETYHTLDGAKKRCWGMVRLACDIKSSEAAKRMQEVT